jgi:hypothetical protein
MVKKTKPNPDNDNFDDSRELAIPPPSKTGALISLADLQTTLNRVDTTSVVGRSGKPMLSFRSREEGGVWTYGQKHTLLEPGTGVAVNPLTFMWGHIAFNDNNRPTERLVSVALPKPDLADLPEGHDWNEQWAVDCKLVTGPDAGLELTYKATTVGGIQAIAGLVDLVRDRLNSGAHSGNIVPVVALNKDSYPRPPYGRIPIPVLTVIGWMALDGPEPAPPIKPPSAAPAAPSEPPRRRRVG